MAGIWNENMIGERRKMSRPCCHDITEGNNQRESDAAYDLRASRLNSGPCLNLDTGWGVLSDVLTRMGVGVPDGRRSLKGLRLR